MGRIPVLSKRLRTAAYLVREGAAVADVGCDHGKLSAFLLDSGRASFVYATDIREQPLEKAAALLSCGKYEGKYECVLTDGLMTLPGERIDDVVIAGVGDDVTEKIIEDAPWLRDPGKRLILVPASRHEMVREFLARRGFSVLSETAVYDRKHNYTVIHAVFSGEVVQLGVRRKWLGDIDTLSGDGELYLKAIAHRMQAIIRSVPDPGNPARAEAEAFFRSLLPDEARIAGDTV